MAQIVTKWVANDAITADKLDDSGNFTINQLTTRSDSTVGGNLYVLNDTTVNNLRVIGNLELTDTTFNDLTVLNDATIGRDASVVRNLRVSGTSNFVDMTSSSGLRVGQDASVVRNLWVGQDTTVNNLRVIGNFELTDTTFTDLTVLNDASVAGDLQVDGLVQFNNYFYAQSRVEVIGEFVAYGDATFTEIVGDNILIYSDASVSGDLEMNGNLIAQNGDTYLKKLFVYDVTSSGGMLVNPNLVVGGNLWLGDTTLNNLGINTDSITVFSDASIGNDASVVSNLWVGNDASVVSNLWVGNDATVVGTLSCDTLITSDYTTFDVKVLPTDYTSESTIADQTHGTIAYSRVGNNVTVMFPALYVADGHLDRFRITPITGTFPIEIRALSDKVFRTSVYSSGGYATSTCPVTGVYNDADDMYALPKPAPTGFGWISPPHLTVLDTTEGNFEVFNSAGWTANNARGVYATSISYIGAPLP